MKKEEFAELLRNCVHPYTEREQKLALELPGISDFEELNEMSRKSPPISREALLIEDRQVEVLLDVLSQPCDFNELGGMREEAFPGSRTEWLLEEQMKKILSQVSHFKELEEMLGEATPGFYSEELIKKKMRGMIINISLGNVPSWFVEFLQCQEKVPAFLTDVFYQKAEELLANM